MGAATSAADTLCSEDYVGISGKTQRYTYSLVIRVVEFSRGGTKFERFLPKNQHIQRKLLNFENWSSSELSTIGQYFIKKLV